MGAVFERWLTSDAMLPFALAHCAIDRFRYRPGKRAIVLYALDLVDLDTGVKTQQWVAGSVFAGGKARRLHAESLTADAGAATSQRQALPRMSLLNELDMLLEWFPHDRHLPQLAAVLGGVHHGLMATLAQVLAARGTPAPTIALRPRRYRPGISTTFSAHAQTSCAATAGPALAYIKLTNPTEDPASARDWQALRTAMAAGIDAPAIPEIWSIGSESSLLAIAPVTGRPLDDLLAHGAGTDAIAGQCARAVYGLNSSDVALSRNRPLPDALKRMERGCDMLAWAAPGQTARLVAIHNTACSSLSETELRPAHLDLKTEHIFIADARTSFIDLDSAAASDPVLDAAQLAARLDILPFQTGAEGAAIRQFKAGFLDAYFSLAPAHWRGNFAPAYAVAAIKTALYFLQHLDARFPERLDTILTAVEQQLGMSSS